MLFLEGCTKNNKKEGIFTYHNRVVSATFMAKRLKNFAKGTPEIHILQNTLSSYLLHFMSYS